MRTTRVSSAIAPIVWNVLVSFGSAVSVIVTGPADASFSAEAMMPSERPA